MRVRPSHLAFSYRRPNTWNIRLQINSITQIYSMSRFDSGLLVHLAASLIEDGTQMRHSAPAFLVRVWFSIRLQPIYHHPHRLYRIAEEYKVRLAIPGWACGSRVRRNASDLIIVIFGCKRLSYPSCPSGLRTFFEALNVECISWLIPATIIR